MAEQMNRWKMSVKKSLSASEETRKSKLGGVSRTFSCVLHVFDLLTQNIAY